jgi:hypothetical protein
MLLDMNTPEELRPTGTMDVTLPSGTVVRLSICRPVFSKWEGAPLAFDYGGKPVLNYKDEACFAELVILRLLLENHWEGVWVETYGGAHFLRSMPQGWNLQSEHVEIPSDKHELLRRIWKAGKTTACFDVFAWRGDQVCFFEGKHAGKDRLTGAQLKFIEGALGCGILPEQLVIVEWSFRA